MKKKKTVSPDTINKDAIAKDLEKVAKKFAKEHPTVQSVTRDYYRVHGKFSEAAIASVFGNFKAAVKFINDKTGKVGRMDIHLTHRAESSSGLYFVTSVIAGARPDNGCLPAIAAFERDTGARVVMLGMKGILKEDESYDEQIVRDWRQCLCTEFVFNSNLFAIDMRLHPQGFKPLTSMSRISNKMTSLIIAHSKQQMEVVPSQENMHSRIMWSTGSITRPYYAGTRSGRFSFHEHISGGLIVEVKDNNIFHVTQVQFDREGSFQYKRKVYTANGIIKIPAKESAADSMTLGDIHAGWVDENARRATFEQIEFYRPEAVYVGDVFDGSSISHHNEHNRYALHKLPIPLRTLEGELHVYAKELELYVKAFPWINLQLVFGNHEDHLLRYLREGRYVDDGAENHYLALELARHMLDDRNPIEEWCKKHYPHLTKNVTWLKQTDYIRRHGIMMTVHGHKGHSGARGSASQLELSYGKSNTGHTHSAKIVNDLYTAGCMCVKNMPYTEGSASKWTHSNIVNLKPRKGFVQRLILNSFYGDWTTYEKQSVA